MRLNFRSMITKLIPTRRFIVAELPCMSEAFIITLLIDIIPKNLVSIAFPMGIGCGLAGGDWNVYLNLIKQFKINNPNTKVTIYKL